MRDNLFDDIIRGSMNNYESPVPESSWNNIAEALRKDKRRRVIFWWRTIIPALLIVAIGTGGYSLYDRYQKKHAAVQSSISSIPNQSNNKSNNNRAGTEPLNRAATNTNTQNSPVAEQGATNENVNNPSTTINNTVAAENVNSTINTASSNKATKENTVVDRNVSTTISSSNRSSDIASNSFVSAKNNSAKLKNNRSGSRTKISNFTDASEQSSSSVSDLTLVSKKKKKQNTNSKIDLPEADLSLAKNEISTVDVAGNSLETNFSLAMLKASQKAKQPSFDGSMKSGLGTILSCPTGRRNDWYLDVFAAPNYTSRSLSNRGNQVALNKKDSTESMKLSFSGGINIGKNIGNSFILKSGINYTLTNEKFSYSKINSIKDILIITVKKIPISPGDTVYVYDTSHVQQIGRLNINTTNRYHSFDIPLILGYETSGDNIRFNINAGVIFNVTTIAKGKTLGAADTAIDLKSSGYYKSNVGFSLYGSVMAIKKISDHLYVFVEPYFRQGLGNMATDKAFFRQTMRSFGLNVGLRIKINPRQR